MDSNQTQLPLSSTDGFTYNINITKDLPLLKNEHFSRFFPNLLQMEVFSHWFDRHQDCQEDAASLLSSIASLMSQTTGLKYAIATKINPCHEDDYDKEADTDPWEETIVMKMFLCDHDVLRNEGIIQHYAVATIRAAPIIHSQSSDLIPQ